MSNADNNGAQQAQNVATGAQAAADAAKQPAAGKPQAPTGQNGQRLATTHQPAGEPLGDANAGTAAPHPTGQGVAEVAATGNNEAQNAGNEPAAPNSQSPAKG